MNDEQKKQKIYELIRGKDRVTYSVTYGTRYSISRDDFERLGNELVAEGRATKSKVESHGREHSIDWGPGFSGL